MSVSAVRAVATRKTWWAALLVALALTGALAPRAGAVLVHLAHGRIAGVLPVRGVTAASIPGSFARRNAASSTTTPDNGTLNYSGGPVLHAEMPYVIFWDPSNQISAADRALYVRFFADSSADRGMATNVYAVARQFTDATGFANYSQTWTAAHALVDTQAFPISQCPVGSGQTACLTDTQLTDELTRLIGASGLPTGVTGSAPLYFIVTPATVNSCFDASGGTCTDTSPGYCAYHSSFMDGPSNVLYADIPILPAAADPKSCQADQYSTVQSPNADQTADVVIKYMSHEYNETITDPLGNAWYDTTSGNENGDNCNFYAPTADPVKGASPNAFSPTLGGSASAGTLYNQVMNGRQYYTQSEWSNGDVGCKMRPTSSSLSADYATSGPAHSGAPVSFSPLGTALAGYSSTTWTFGDGSSKFSLGAPGTVSHSYSSTGTYTVIETVVDANGQLTTATHNVTVASGSPGPSPTAAFTVTTSAPVSNDPVSFNGSGSSASSGSLSYSWNFGDGGTDTTSGATPSHSYASPGTYVVELTVSDGGTATANISHTVTVAQPTPSAAFTIATVSPRAGSPVSFDGSGSGERGGSIASFAWTFGDGSSGSGVAPSHSYSTPGSYLVALTVTDPNGQSASASHVVTVAAASAPPPTPPPAPSPSKGSPSAAISVTTSHPIAGATTAFSGSGSSDTGSTLVAYGWTFGDGGSATGVTPGHRFAHPGTYTVTLNVRDATGATATTSQRVTVKSAGITGVKIKTGKTVERLTLSLSGPGTLTWGKLKFKIKRAGNFVFKLTLTKAQRNRLHQHHSLKIKLTFKFKPTVGSSLSKTVSFKVTG